MPIFSYIFVIFHKTIHIQNAVNIAKEIKSILAIIKNDPADMAL